LGPCRINMSEAEYSPEIGYPATSNPPVPANVGNPHSFALINGTAEIRENIFIPLQINRGNDNINANSGNNKSGNYNINHTAQLWINGGEVTKGRLGDPSAANGTALVLYGSVKVTSGVLNVFCNAGIVIRGNGVIQVDGGLVETNQIQTSTLGPTNIGGLIINDGVVNINGNGPGGARHSYTTLSLTYPGNLFRMTGGTLKVTGPTTRGLVFINSDPQNTSVTGGTVH